MEIKKSTPTNTVTRKLVDLDKETGNIYETVNIIARRANQISTELKAELTRKLADFSSPTDTMEETFENREQIEISRYYERLPSRRRPPPPRGRTFRRKNVAALPGSGGRRPPEGRYSHVPGPPYPSPRHILFSLGLPVRLCAGQSSRMLSRWDCWPRTPWSKAKVISTSTSRGSP